ncbi:MAG: hypothetical protein WC518_02040 [Patescibacteria group bacterium]
MDKQKGRLMTDAIGRHSGNGSNACLDAAFSRPGKCYQGALVKPEGKRRRWFRFPTGAVRPK